MPRIGFDKLKQEMPQQAVCRACNTEYVTGGPASTEHHCDLCGWNFLCPTCTGPRPDPDDLIGFSRWLVANRSRINAANCPGGVARPLTFQDSEW